MTRLSEKAESQDGSGTARRRPRAGPTAGRPDPRCRVGWDALTWARGRVRSCGDQQPVRFTGHPSRHGETGRHLATLCGPPDASSAPRQHGAVTALTWLSFTSASLLVAVATAAISAREDLGAGGVGAPDLDAGHGVRSGPGPPRHHRTDQRQARPSTARTMLAAVLLGVAVTLLAVRFAFVTEWNTCLTCVGPWRAPARSATTATSGAAGSPPQRRFRRSATLTSRRWWPEVAEMALSSAAAAPPVYERCSKPWPRAQPEAHHVRPVRVAFDG